ncbi:AAA family ATPase, partial [Anabaena catenula]
SQILPVLVLCYYAPKGSTLIFEQPEIHLHPSVQAGLADVFIDVIKNRNMQIIYCPAIFTPDVTIALFLV